MDTKKPITIGTVGYGYGAFLHVNGYLNAGGIPIRLKTVCARNAEKAEAFRAKYGYEQVCTSYEELVADPEIDLIDLSVPPRLHIPYCIMALRAGKNVICEKPVTGYFGDGSDDIGRTVSKADMWREMDAQLAELKKAIDESEAQFFYAEDFVYATPVQKAAEILRAKKSKIMFMNGIESIIGSTSEAASEWKNFGGGTMMRNGIHILSTMMYLKQVEAQARGEDVRVRSVTAEMGQISKVRLAEGERQYAQAHPNDVEDCANVILTFSDGSMCNIIGTDAVIGGSANQVTVACNDMKFQMNITQNDMLKTYCCDDNGLDGVYWGELNPPKTGWNNVFVSDEVIRGYTGEMKAFLEAMAYGTKPETSFELAYEIIRVVYAAFRSAEEGRRIDLM
ncbi:MAG: Gfo/Idh/MocA family oxidoreductase [Lachnospiraceae bacterium]|nr:Gfo/Idh/MocA family oxidoreductase [Lachnospiraceae bacterium]